MSHCRAIACANRGCQSTIHLHHDVEERLRRTHETFYCPAGHENYFPGKTTQEKELEQLHRRLESTEDRVLRFRELWHEAVDQRDEWKLQARRCPLGCGYRVLRKWKLENIEATLAMHLVEEHGARIPEPEEVTVAA